MEASLLSPQSNHAIMDQEEEEEELGSMSSFSDIDDDDDDDDDVGGEGSSNSVGSSSSDFTEVDASSSMEGPLFEMTSLLLQLPFKRGLSKHFEGKSQSFTSLSNVKSLEDLVKPERPLLLFRRNRRLKSSRSCGWGLGSHSRAITKKSSRGSSSSSLGSSSGMKRSSSFLGAGRPPIPP